MLAPNEGEARIEPVDGFAELGMLAFTTTRLAGDFALGSAEPAASVVGRWIALGEALRNRTPRLVVSPQVHGELILEHESGWQGWLRATEADGHIAIKAAVAMAVTVADCVPVFIGHASGAGAILHAGWRGVAAEITRRALERLSDRGLRPVDCLVHAGPSICGQCYEVGPDVYQRLTGQSVASPTVVDLRLLVAGQARAAGVKRVTVSDWCTRHHKERFFSHRGGDAARQVAVLVAGGARKGE